MKPSSANDVRRMYDTTADSYADMMEEEIKLPVYSDTLQRLHKEIAELPGILVDTACGSGHMLRLYRDHHDSQRELVGVDLSPQMVSHARKRLGSNASVLVGDMCDLKEIESGSAAAVLNWYAIHHLSAEGVRAAMQEWLRILVPGGRLLLAAWEGAGQIDYGDASEIVAIRYSDQEISKMAGEAGFRVASCVVAPVQDFPMDAVYLECVKR